MEFEFSKDTNLPISPHNFTESPVYPGMLGGGTGNIGCVSGGTSTVRKRVLKTDSGNRSHLFFCGKRKRSNRDRYNEQEHGAGGLGGGTCSGSSKLHSSSMPRYTHMEEYHRMRPRSYSSTSKPNSDRLLPLNKGCSRRSIALRNRNNHKRLTIHQTWSRVWNTPKRSPIRT